MSEVVYNNTPKGVGADGNADVPSAYLVRKLICVNQNGVAIDISPLVVSFTITEELFSPIVVLNLKVRDTVNFFEDFSLNGQEVIQLELDHITKTAEVRHLKLEFNVKEYPNYQKTASEPNVQEYNIVAVSKFAYSSMLQRISRSVKGNPVDNISRIFKDDLDVPVTVKGVCSSTFDGIITIQSPMKAAEWLRMKAFDVAGSPFFIYSNISTDGVILNSLSELWSKRNEVFRKYQYRQYFANPINSPESYNEQAIRILDMRSNIKLDKLTAATQGGFASTTRITDIATKSFSEMLSSNTSPDDKTSMSNPFSTNGNILLGPKSGGLKSLTDLPGASISNISTNTQANYQGNPNSSTGPVADNIARAKSFYANSDSVSHQIMVYGDFNLNPGKKIVIEIPKSINPADYAKNKGMPNDDELDKSMSGEYVIAVVAHSFSDGLYVAKAKIIRQS